MGKNLAKDITILDILQVWNVIMNLQQSTNDQIMADNHEQNERLIRSLTLEINKIATNQKKMMDKLGIEYDE